MRLGTSRNFFFFFKVIPLCTSAWTINLYYAFLIFGPFGQYFGLGPRWPKDIKIRGYFSRFSDKKTGETTLSLQAEAETQRWARSMSIDELVAVEVN